MEYGEKRDYPKINIYTITGKYLCSTTWAKSLKEAKQKYAEKNGLTSISYLKASFDKPKTKELTICH